MLNELIDDLGYIKYLIDIFTDLMLSKRFRNLQEKGNLKILEGPTGSNSRRKLDLPWQLHLLGE